MRHLAEAGIRRIVHLSTRDFDRSWSTRFSSEKHKAPSPLTAPGDLLKFLMDPAHPWEGGVLFPTTDPAACFVSKNLSEIEARFRTPILPWKHFERVQKKHLLYMEARKIGVPTPRVLFPENPESLAAMLDDIDFPCILKPCQTPAFYATYHRKALVFDNPDDLTAGFDDAWTRGLPVMVSEIIPGDESDIFSYRSYIDSRGSRLTEIMTRKVRQHPRDFGVGHVQKTIPMHPEIRDLSLRLLGHLDYRGFSSVEFKRDSRDSAFKLMEINTRALLCQPVLQKAGCPIAHIIYRDLAEEVRIPVSGYRTDVYFIHRFFDIQEMLGNLREKKRSWRAFLRPYMKRRKVFAIPFWKDPQPFLVNLRVMVRGFIRARFTKRGR